METADDLRMTVAFILAGFVTMTSLSAILLIHLRRRRHAAHQGDEEAAKKVILPAFEPLLVLLGIVDGPFVIFLTVTLATGYYDNLSQPTVVEAIYCGHHLVDFFWGRILVRSDIWVWSFFRSKHQTQPNV